MRRDLCPGSNPAPDTTHFTDKFITFTVYVNSVEVNEKEQERY